MPGKTRRVYLVVCHCWSYDDEWWTGDDKPVKAFSERGSAEAYLARCEQDHVAWERVNGSPQLDTRFTIVEMDVEA